MADFVSDTRILWTKDRTGVVPATDKDADPGAIFAGVGGVVYEDQARLLGLIGDGGGLTTKGKELGYLAGTTQPERPAGTPRGETRSSATAPSVPTPPAST